MKSKYFAEMTLYYCRPYVSQHAEVKPKPKPEKKPAKQKEQKEKVAKSGADRSSDPDPNRPKKGQQGFQERMKKGK